MAEGTELEVSGFIFAMNTLLGHWTSQTTGVRGLDFNGTYQQVAEANLHSMSPNHRANLWKCLQTGDVIRRKEKEVVSQRRIVGDTYPQSTLIAQDIDPKSRNELHRHDKSNVFCEERAAEDVKDLSALDPQEIYNSDDSFS